MEIEIDFTDKEITPWGGMVLMKKLIEKTGIIETLNKLQLPTQGSNRGYNPIQIIMSFWVSIWCGASRFESAAGGEVTRQDEVIRKLGYSLLSSTFCTS